MKSLNVYFVGKEQVELREEEQPRPGPGQVLVQASRTLISTGTELICYARNFAPGTHWHNWVTYPFTPGYSMAGVVMETGEGVEEFVPGDRVALRSPHRQFVTTASSNALRIPDGVSDEDATWFGLASITQNGVRKAQHLLGDTVVVIGLGILGQLVTQYVRISGAREVIAVDTSEARLNVAAAHGATHALNLPVQEAKQEVARLTAGRLADVVYDVTGHAPVFSHALGLARTLGKVILLGDSGTPSEQRLAPDLITRGLTVLGAHDVNPPRIATEHAWWTNRNMQELFFQYVERGQMQVGDLVTARCAPRDAADAYAALLRDRSTALGVIFDWTNA